MEEDLKEIDKVPEGKYEIVETKKELIDEDEPLDLGKPHIMSEEEYEDFKKSLEDNEEKKIDIIESKKDYKKGYLDDENKWHGDKDEEPLFGKNGELRTLNDEEIPLTEEEKKELNKNIENDSTDLTKDISNEDLEKNKTKKSEKTEEPEKIEKPYIKYEETEDYKDRTINGTGEDLHKGLINHLRNYVKEDMKEDLPPINDKYKK